MGRTPHSQISERVDEIEQQLKLSLRPVQPDREFVDHLYTRLTSPSITVLERRESLAFSLLLAAAALLLGVVLIVLMRLLRKNE